MNIPVYTVFTSIVCLGSELTSGLAAIGIIIMAMDDLFKKTAKARRDINEKFCIR